MFSNLPNKPGIYKFLDKNNQIIYVGKAINLKKRVASYFQKQKNISSKNQVLISKIAKIEHIEVNNELEAILLETNLIKELQPKYNILMKDDKNFIYLKITTQEEYPKFYLTRTVQNDKATYIGPRTSGFDLKTCIKLLSDLLPYYKCQLNVTSLKNNKIPQSCLCMFKKIDPDHTPCLSEAPPQVYQTIVKEIINFLQGKHKKTIKILENTMQKLAHDKQFEEALLLRKKLEAIYKIIEKQNITNTKQENLDVITLHSELKHTFVNLFEIRSGKLINQNNFTLNTPSQATTPELYEFFINHYYLTAQNPPKTLYLTDKPSNHQQLEQLYHFKIVTPKIGTKKNLLDLSTKNTLRYAKQQRISFLNNNSAKSPTTTLKELQELLSLPKIPNRIECYDISHLQGTHTVGSLVVLDQGIPNNQEYRLFKLKTLNNQIDDYKALQEVLLRRLKYIAKLPIDYSIRNGILSHKKQPLAQITIEKQLLTINKIPKVEPYILEIFIKKFLEKNKSSKYLIKSTNQTLTAALINLGFHPITHPSANFGLYKHSFSKSSFQKTPNLIIIDGGKGQLSSALKALKHYNLNIPIISIAKKQEIIHTADKKELILPHTHNVLKLVQQIRDEAHRFAITKNKHLRQREMLGLNF